jgi:Restriction endonuclease XhoI
LTPGEHQLIVQAIDIWFKEKDAAAARSEARGQAQQGRRASVTGGAHLKGFEELVVDQISAAGVHGLTVKRNRSATLAGWYRSSKNWDLLILEHGSPILAVEFKSMSGSEGKNLNNRADEMYGVAEDAKQAEARGVLPKELRRAFIFIMEANAESQRPVALLSPYGSPDPIFAGKSYRERSAIMLARMRESGLYHLVWSVGAVRNPIGFVEPDPTIGWDRFARDLRSGFRGGQPQPAAHP